MEKTSYFEDIKIKFTIKLVKTINYNKQRTVPIDISPLFDVKKTFENPTASNITDVGLDAVGLFGGTPGALISIYGSATKVEVEWWAQTMAEGTVEFNNRAKEYMDEKMMEEMERYEQ